MHLPEPIKQWLPTALIGCSVGALAYFAAKIIDAASGPFWQHIAPAIPQTLLLPLCCLLLLVSVLLALWVWYLHASRSRAHPRDNFLFDKSNGIVFHRKTKDYFCTQCFLCDPPVFSPLYMVALDGIWMCGARGCGASYYRRADDQRDHNPKPAAVNDGRPDTGITL